MRRASVPLLFLRGRAPTPLFSLSKPSPSLLSTSSSQPPHPPPWKPSASLTDNELAEINALIPRLCDAGRHHDAIRLLDACLLSAPPLTSLPLPDLADRLASHPDMAPSMALLTALRHHPRRPSPLPFCSLLLSSYFRGHRLREAAKIFAWLCRPDSPCRPDPEVYAIAIGGFCRHRRALEALRVLREMVRDGFSLELELRVAVCRSLLWEARVDEARELEAELGHAAEGSDGFHCVAELLDRIIKDWEVGYYCNRQSTGS